MYCRTCGYEASGRFCSHCGKPVGGDSLKTCDSIAHVLENHESKKYLSGQEQPYKSYLGSDDYLKGLDRALSVAFDISPLIPMDVCARGGRAIWSFLGISIAASQSRSYNRRYPYITLACLSYLCRKGMDIISISENGNKGVIQARVPDSFLTWEGRLLIAIQNNGSTIDVGAGVNFKGQRFDWGKGNRILDELLLDIDVASEAIMRSDA
jgi:hypothetical protein